MLQAPAMQYSCASCHAVKAEPLDPNILKGGGKWEVYFNSDITVGIYIVS